MNQDNQGYQEPSQTRECGDQGNDKRMSSTRTFQMRGSENQGSQGLVNQRASVESSVQFGNRNKIGYLGIRSCDWLWQI